MTATALPQRDRSERIVGAAVLACALVFNAVFLAPELRIGRLPPNDSAFHLAAAERLLQSVQQGEPALDPWVSEWSLGYPVWRSYQPLPHLLAAGILRLADGYIAHDAAFAGLQYALLVLLPLSAFGGARLLGLGPLGAGLASLLILAPSETGDLGRYGLGYGAFVWRGSGLYTQLVALHFLLLSLGVVTRALDTGRSRGLASGLLAATALSHLVFGYVAFVSAVLCAVVGPSGERARRLTRLAMVVLGALLLLLWFVVPLCVGRAEVNHSRWEAAYKWDSFGAHILLPWLTSGELLDSGRAPLLSLLVAAGALLALVAFRDALPRRLLGLSMVWFALFCGRETWGHLLVLVAVPADLHLHRLQAVFELAVVLLAAWGIERALQLRVPPFRKGRSGEISYALEEGSLSRHFRGERARVRGSASRLLRAGGVAALKRLVPSPPPSPASDAGEGAWRVVAAQDREDRQSPKAEEEHRKDAPGHAGAIGWLRLGLGMCLAAALIAIGVDRAHYLRDNTRWGERSLASYEADRADLDQARAAVGEILAERPGRVSAGKAATWGNQFKIGDVPVYAFLTRAHFDQASFLYHSMSLTSDVMVLREESDAAHDTVFGVRAVIAPADASVPPHLQVRERAGRFAVYTSSGEGYFGLVDVGARYAGRRTSAYDVSAAWLESAWLRDGIVVALDETVSGVPPLEHWQPFPPATERLQTPRGRIIAEAKEGETYRAFLQLVRPCHALVKITWHPDLVARVDGHPAPLVRVTPGFVAVPVPAGVHQVEVHYAPGPLKPWLLLAGVVLFAVFTGAFRGRAAAAADDRLSARLAVWGEWLATPRVSNAAVLLALTVLAVRPLFRGQLIDGHDGLEYPPRLVEFSRALRDGQVPPLWAPDLGAGHGQPLFEFAPSLLYLAAAPFYASGCGLADSLQLALACLCGAGAVAVYRIGRRRGVSRQAARVGAAAWLFAPYLALDLFVRAAFAEAAAVAVTPIALLGLVAALDQPSAVRVACGAGALALIPLAHNAVALLVLPALVIIVLIKWDWRRCLIGGLTIALGLGLSAFFWLPALFEKEFVKIDQLREGLSHWSTHAVDAAQLVWSPWGYGLSVAGPGDGMSFAIGPLHLIFGVLGLVLVLRAHNRGNRREAVAFAVIVVTSAWLATSWSGPLWSRVPTLQYLAYPWRALLLPATFLPLLAMAAFEWLSPRLRRGALIALTAINLAHTAPKDFLTFDDEYFAPASIAEKGLNTTTYEEYEPRWVQVRPPYTDRHLIGRDGQLDVRELTLGSTHQEFVVQASSPTIAEATTFYYPGWTVHVDGRDVPVRPVPGSGTMSFPLPAGAHHVALDLQPTPLRRAAARATMLAAAAIFLVFPLRLKSSDE